MGPQAHVFRINEDRFRQSQPRRPEAAPAYATRLA